MPPVSTSSSRLIYDALKACGVRLISALPETWLVHLVRMADDDPDMTLVRLAKEEEGVGSRRARISSGVKSAMLMQNHGFLAPVNGIVSCAQLYRIPLLMLISSSRIVRRARSVADRRRRRDRGRAARASHRLRRGSMSRSRVDAPNRRGADAGLRVEQAGGAAAVPRPDVGGHETARRAARRSTTSSRSASSSRSWAPWRRSCSRSAIGRTSSTCSTRWGWHRRWGWGSRCRGRSCQVIVLDGDGSVLMNLGGLTTLARYRPTEPAARRLRQRKPAVGGRLSDGDVDRHRYRGIARAAGVPRTAMVALARRVHACFRRRAGGEGTDDDRREGRGGGAVGIPDRPRLAGEQIPVPALSEGRGPQDVTLDSVHSLAATRACSTKAAPM